METSLLSSQDPTTRPNPESHISYHPTSSRLILIFFHLRLDRLSDFTFRFTNRNLRDSKDYIDRYVAGQNIFSNVLEARKSIEGHVAWPSFRDIYV